MPEQRKTSKTLFVLFFVLLVCFMAIFTAVITSGASIPVLQPKGTIAMHQRNLIIVATLLMMLVVIPVFVLTFLIAWKYRAGNTKAKHQPDWDSDKRLETAWWGIPLIIIAILSVITWQSSHDLDPYKPIASDRDPIKVQVVALQWKWLFIYPEHGIATVNYLQFPEDVPINFDVTADAPMNSFWIPQLGGQVYAMAGMSTKLHLMASETGEFEGSSANLSGEGFSDMRFKARASSEAEFRRWVYSVQTSENVLTDQEYATLVKPSKKHSPAQYRLEDEKLYTTIIDKYMVPSSGAESPGGHTSASENHGGHH